jgi:nucleoside-diphosphate-sugar epimerase
VPRSVKQPLKTHENNVTGTLNMLYAAKEADVERFVFAASSSAYGDTPVLPKVETMAPMPMSPYAASKVACENYCSAFFSVYGLPTVSLRYFNIFGPRQRPDGPYAAVIPRFFDGLVSGDEVTIFGDGEQTRDFNFVGNAVDANILAAEASDEAFGKVINVAGGERISVNQLFDEIAKLVGSDQRPIHGPARLGDVRDSLADIDRARDLLGYTPVVDWPTGLKKIAETLGI